MQNGDILRRYVREETRLTSGGESVFGLSGMLDKSSFLVTSCGEVHGAIEELIDPAEHLMFRQDFDLEAGPGFAVEKVPKIVFRQDDGPEEFAERHSLAITARANFGILALDILFGAGRQPLPEMAIDFVNTLLELVLGHFAERRKTQGAPDAVQQFLGELMRMRLDKTDQPVA